MVNVVEQVVVCISAGLHVNASMSTPNNIAADKLIEYLPSTDHKNMLIFSWLANVYTRRSLY